MRTNMFSKALSSFAFLLLFVGFSSFAQAQAPVNIALNKPATQSSEDAGGAAGRANDGNPNPNFSAGSVSHTRNGPNEFWMVNLQGNFAITGIRITNRADCCSERIVGATVLVLDNTGQVKWSSTITGASPVYQFPVPNGIQGSFVRVLNKPGQVLSMAEVEVFGFAAAPAAPVAAAPVVAAPVAAAPVAVFVPFISCQHMSNTLGINSLTSWGGATKPYQLQQWILGRCSTKPQTASEVTHAACLQEQEAKNHIWLSSCQTPATSWGGAYLTGDCANRIRAAACPVGASYTSGCTFGISCGPTTANQ